jgi:hypothetical protein
MVSRAINTRPRYDFAADILQSLSRGHFDRLALRTEDQLDFEFDSALGINVFAGEDCQIFFCHAVTWSPWSQVAKLREQSPPRRESGRKGSAREPITPEAEKLPQSGRIRNEQVKDRIFVVVIRLEIFGAEKFESGNARGRAGEIGNIPGQLKNKKPFRRHAIGVGAQL